MIRFHCPQGHPLSVGEDLAGQKVRCGGCRSVVLVPENPEAVQAGAPAAPAEWPQPAPAATAVAPAGLASAAPRRPGRSQPWSLPDTEKEVEEELSTRRRGKVRRAVQNFLRGPKTMPNDVCRPDSGRVWATCALAVILMAAVAFSLIPVFWLGHLDMEKAPGWARAACFVAVLQLVYIAWMANAPDWGSVWVVMLVFALTATGYAAATAIALATQLHESLPLGLAEVRNSAGKWCAAVMAVMALATYLCGRLSTRWNRQFREEILRHEQRRSRRR